MQDLHAPLHTGAIVLARGDRWSVVGVRAFESGDEVVLDGCGAENRGRRATLLAPIDRIEPERRLRPVRRPRPEVVRSILGALARDRPPRGLWTAVDGRFDLLPWQLAPVLAVLAGATRLLLADAVGLGKTLQAGLIAAELSARGLVARTLVLTPPALREAWATELGHRLGLEVAVVDAPWISRHAREHAAGANPWTAAPVVVSSIDLVKQPEVCAAAESAPIDLLVVDEAHHATPGSDRAALVRRLSRRAPWVVLASATPHSGDVRAFRTLLEMGALGGPDEPPMLVVRRSARNAGILRARRSLVLRVTPTDAERALVDQLVTYARDLCAGPAGLQPATALLAGVLARRAASSAWAAELTLRRRLQALEGDTPATAPPQASLPWDEVDDGDLAGDAWLGMAGLADRRQECRRLLGLIATARAARTDSSKFRWLARFIRRTREPVVIFTEFRDTLDACRLALSPAVVPSCLHGGLAAHERRQALGDFLDGRADVLLATDVAGEGLSLQARSRLVVTIEWPWSPHRLEQRVGRVDRLGQARTVHAVHLTSRGTFEERVLARLLRRDARSRDELDRTAATSTALAIHAAVLGFGPGEPVPAPPASEAGDPAVPGALDEASRLRYARGLSACGKSPSVRPGWALPRRGARPSRVVALVEVYGSHRGEAAWSTCVPVAVSLARRPATRREWRQACGVIAASEPVRRAAAQVAPPAPEAQPQWGPASARVQAIRHALADSAPQMVQPSLFDRRAVRDAEAREAVLASLDAHLLRLGSRLGTRDADASVDSRVLAVLPLGSEAP